MLFLLVLPEQIQRLGAVEDVGQVLPRVLLAPEASGIIQLPEVL